MAFEPVEWRMPSPRFLWVHRWEAVVLTLAAVLVFAVSGAASGSDVLLGLAIASVVAGAIAWSVAGRRYRSWGYAEREDDLLVRRGILFARLSVVPYGRMQYIDVTAGPIERALRLATVRLHTAAAATDARIPGLDREEAARLRDRLAELGEAQAAGL
jgi:membrane protein YdbS with pleckstrin-like domain